MRFIAVILTLGLTSSYVGANQEDYTLSAKVIEVDIRKVKGILPENQTFNLKTDTFGSYMESTNVQFTFERSLSDTVEIKRTKGNSQFRSFVADARFAFDSEIDNSKKGNFMKFLSDAYTFTTYPHANFQTDFQHTITYPIQINENIVIEPCQVCKVQATVMQIKDQRFDYFAAAHITGKKSETERLNGKEIKQILPNHFVNSTVEDYFKVKAYFTGSLTISYFLEPKVEKRCRAIQNCWNDEISTVVATQTTIQAYESTNANPITSATDSEMNTSSPEMNATIATDPPTPKIIETTQTIPVTPTTALTTYIEGDSTGLYKNYRIIFSDPDTGNVLLNAPIFHECMDIAYWPGIKKTEIESEICVEHFANTNCTGAMEIVNLTLSKRDFYSTRQESFRPCDVNQVFSTKFHNLTFKMMEFNVDEGLNNSPGLAVSMNVQEYSRNETLKEFIASTMVTEKAEIERDLMSSQIVKVHISPNATVNVKSSNATDIIKGLIQEAYPFDLLRNESASAQINFSKNRTIELTHSSKVIPCVINEVYGLLIYKENVSFKYTARVHVTGINYLGNLVNANEIKETLVDKYVVRRIVDDDTVEVEFTGSLVASYVETAEINFKDVQKDNCRTDCNEWEGLYQADAETCRKCHPQCKSCTGSKLEECIKCKSVRNDGICTDTCPNDKEDEDGICIASRGISNNTTGNGQVTQPNGSKTGIFVGVGLALAIIIAGAVIAVYMKRRPRKSAIRNHQLKEIASAPYESDHLLQNTGIIPNIEERNISGPTQVETIPTTEPAKKESLSDQLTAQLDLIKIDVMKLETEVRNFEGPHFTKVYRTLQGDCSKMQMDLDKLQVEGREALRGERRKLYVKIDKLADELAEKAHSDGRICELCEVKE